MIDATSFYNLLSQTEKAYRCQKHCNWDWCIIQFLHYFLLGASKQSQANAWAGHVVPG